MQFNLKLLYKKRYLVFTLTSKHFRFSSRQIRFLEVNKYSVKAPSSSQIIFRKSCEGASTSSKWFGNGSKNSGLGEITPPPLHGVGYSNGPGGGALLKVSVSHLSPPLPPPLLPHIPSNPLPHLTLPLQRPLKLDDL